MYGKGPGGEQNESWDKLGPVLQVVVVLCRV
jgi:hypothetical protein